MLLSRFDATVTTLLGTIFVCACHSVRVEPPVRVATTFVCADSLRRADGTQASTTCVLGREYCYEASGGAAISHGAHCRALPRPEATCADLPDPAGSSCTGSPETGLRMTFAFP